MKKNRAKSHKASAHQTVTEEFKLHTGQQTIKITTTEQKLSVHAGQTAFWGFAYVRKVRTLLAGLLPHRPTSPNALPPVEIALGFVAGVLAGATRLAQVAWLRGDAVLPAVMEIRRLPSQPTLTRFFAHFKNLGTGAQCWRGLWRWSMERLASPPGGYALDLDSTTLRHVGQQQQGVRTGYTPSGLKPCLHPLLAVLAEAKLCVQLWLRPGNTHSANHVVGFTQELLANLPSHIHLRVIRADAGFQTQQWLALLEERRLRFIVAADFSRRLVRFVTKQTRWQPTTVPGTEVADAIYESILPGGRSQLYRLILIRRSVEAPQRSGGKELIACPGFRFQALLTNLPPRTSAFAVWSDYNPRAGIENVIKELKQGFGLGSFCCRGFYATEAALSLTVFTYNLSVLFARHLGWLEKQTIATLRYRLFTCAGIISRSQGQLTLRLNLPAHARAWWRGIWEKVMSPFPNCNSVGQSPPSS